MSRKSLNVALLRKRFIIPASIHISEIKTVLCKNFHCEESPVRLLQRSFQDSFDWRIYRAGAVIETESSTGFSAISWRDLKSGNKLDSATIQQAVRFAREIPPGRLRARVEPLLEMRALLPLAEIRGKVHGFKVLNKDDKTVVYLIAEDMQFPATGKPASIKLPVTLSVEPVKGYSEQFLEVSELLEKQFSLKPDKQDSALRIFESAGLQPGNYKAKLNFQLTPDMRSDAAVRTIFQSLLETILANENGLKADWDSEFLHDYRVAIRRTRSLLGQSKEVMPQRILEKFRREFSWLGEITTPCRDMDVYLLDFDTFKNSLPLPLRVDINAFHDFLERRQKVEHVLLVKQLESVRYHKLISDWDAYLTSTLPMRSSLPNALCPVYELACKRLWRMYRRVINEGEAIRTGSPPEDLHELRKSCKKLRYLMEFFLSIFPQNKIRQLINVLKSLQDQLGEYQDLHVQLASLATIRTQMIAEKLATERMLVAFDLIMLTIDQRQEKVREIFSERFDEFADKKNQDNFAELFKKMFLKEIPKPEKE